MRGKAKVLIILLSIVAVGLVAAVSPASAERAAGHSDFLYVADYNHDIVHVYNVSSPSLSRVAAIHVEKPSSVVASRDGKRVFAASSGLLTSRLYEISTANNTVLASHLLPDDGAGAIAISPDDLYVYIVTATRFIVLDTASGKQEEHTLDTDRYTTMTTAADETESFAFFAAPGSSKLYVYNANDKSLNTFRLNCEIGNIKALDTTHILSTDRLGEINILKYYNAVSVDGWSYTPRPIGGASMLFVPYLAVSNNQNMSYLVDRENNKVYQVNLGDYSAVLLENVSDWRSPAKAAFGSDDTKVFICDDTGVTGLYTADHTQYNYYYGYKALDLAVASVPDSQASGKAQVTPTINPLSPSPEATGIPTSQPSPVQSPTATAATTPTLTVLPLMALLLATGFALSRK